LLASRKLAISPVRARRSTVADERPSRVASSLFYLARLMGSSVEQIDARYGHMLPDSEEYLRGLLDSFDAADEEEAEGLGH
jgi:hypothetical protein